MNGRRDKHPGDRQLRRGAALGGGMRLQFLDQRQVAREVFGLEARHAAARVALAQPVEPGHPAGQEAAPQRAVGDKADAELLAKRQHLGLDVAGPQRILDLHRAHRMDRMGAPDRRRRRPRKCRDGAPCPGARDRPSRRPCPRSARPDRRGGCNRDRSHRSAAASGSCRRPRGHIRDGRRKSADRRCSSRLPNLLAITYSPRCPSTARAISSSLRPGAVGVGGVEKIDAELARPADRRDRRVRIGRVVERRHRRAAEPDRRDLQLAQACAAAYPPSSIRRRATV